MPAHVDSSDTPQPGTDRRRPFAASQPVAARLVVAPLMAG